jgi:hypothetical protein
VRLYLIALNVESKILFFFFFVLKNNILFFFQMFGNICILFVLKYVSITLTILEIPTNFLLIL